MVEHNLATAQHAHLRHAAWPSPVHGSKYLQVSEVAARRHRAMPRQWASYQRRYKHRPIAASSTQHWDFRQ
jgi:hypothetical protein